MHFSKIKIYLMSKYFLYNKSKNIKPIYDKEIDLSSIAEWIACGFF